jgi:putative transposase
MEAVSMLRPRVGTKPACAALGLARATWYRKQRPIAAGGPRTRRRIVHRALATSEQRTVLDTLRSERFVDCAPATVFATLLDEGSYLCSVRTMYRVLAAHAEVRERRDQLRRPNYKRPELLATHSNQVWSWDITKLLGPAKWTYYYLYVILDIFSRYVPGWMVAERESDSLAHKLIAETCAKENIQPGQLTIHADRGPSMTSKQVALLLADLGVTKTHSRPHVSNDNPYSESQFKTLKYRPNFPDRFGGLQDARAYSRALFEWYNHAHRHSGIGYLTPASVHHGHAEQITAARASTLLAAYHAHPERFTHKVPQPPALPTAAWINPPRPLAEASALP